MVHPTPPAARGPASGYAADRLLHIPAGSVTLRDARSGRQAVVELNAFRLARTTVTLGGSDVPWAGVTWFTAVTWCNEASAADGRAPAYRVDGRSVTWDVSADGYRLPTEAEWEFACRAGTTTPTYGPLHDVAWTALDDVDEPQPVGRKAANAFGLTDMLGNVWEWCWDYADTARYGDYRSLRGGGWADQPWSCRASVRRASAPDAVLEDVGFRVAQGPVGIAGDGRAQGWSARSDRARADIRGPLPMGWTPLRDLLD